MDRRLTGFLRLTLIAAASPWVPVLAQDHQFSTPQDLLSSLYEVVLFGSRPTTYYAPFFSDRLTALLSSGILGPEEFRTLGFDPLTGFTGATLVTVFNLETMRQGPLTAEAIARFNADDVPVTITFSLVREAAEGWQVDDLQGTSGDREWTLSDLIDAVRAEDQ
jgi:hypothetical protein